MTQMTLADLVQNLDLTVSAGAQDLGREVTGGYVSDLLSDVIANARDGDVWITLQLHQNIIAVAFLNNLAGIIIVNGRQPEDATIKKAEEQGVVVMCSSLPTYEVAGRLYQLGVRREI
ncbi:MAG: DRTGG domain-containing protein [Deltaproteobacteria bacterium]|nr:DRTGG domain-containing protein [Deltaproteobacteria bacterium]